VLVKASRDETVLKPVVSDVQDWFLMSMQVLDYFSRRQVNDPNLVSISNCYLFHRQETEVFTGLFCVPLSHCLFRVPYVP
jgi:hypothetical protein